MANSIEYAIYVRKSTEDETWMRQAQSIPDQIKACMDFAKRENLMVKMKTADFPFETEAELRNEDNDKDPVQRAIYQKYRNYYIIRERKSGKEWWERPKFNMLIKKIRKGEIKWLISYSPDRQARNMVDGWNIIDCVDKWLIDLKYTNFNFENNAAWKMMLWMWFVFSKQYSDKLSEDVDRWKKSAVSKWKGQWEFKYWYIRDKETGYFVPDWKNFDLMKEAFRMKVEDKASDMVIAQYLNDNWFVRNHGKHNRSKLHPSTLSDVWVDSFYYWLYKLSDYEQDLRELELANFQPMISEEWHNILMARRFNNAKPEKTIKENRVDEELFSFPAKSVLSYDWFVLAPYLTKKKARLKNLEKAKETNPNATLLDVTKSSQVRYEAQWAKKPKDAKDIKWRKLAINQDELENAMMYFLSHIKISDEMYQSYVEYVKKQVDDGTENMQTRRKKLQMDQWKVESERLEYVKQYMGYKFKNEDEMKLYNEKLASFDRRTKMIEEEIASLTETWRNIVMEADMLFKLLKFAPEMYAYASSVRKKKIFEIFISNLKVDKKRWVTIEPHPFFENIFEKIRVVQGWQESNSRRAALETTALPLSYSPMLVIQPISLILCLKHDISSKEH